MRWIAVIAILAACAGWAQAQMPQVEARSAAWKPTPVVAEAQSNLVPLEVVVRRSDGTVITSLDRDHFRVLNEGKTEALSQFSVVKHGRAPATVGKSGASSAMKVPPASAMRPRYVALFFDDVNTANGDLEHARNAALRFLRQESAPSDHIGIFTTSGEDQLAFTNDTATLTAAVGKIWAHPRASRENTNACPRITPFQAYQITVLHLSAAFQAAIAEMLSCRSAYAESEAESTGMSMQKLFRQNMLGTSPEVLEVDADADAIWNLTRGNAQDTLAAIKDVVNALASEPGKRILLLASGGFLSETLGADQERLVDAAQHAQVVINSLNARGLYTEPPGRALGFESDAGILPLITYFYEFDSRLSANQAMDATMVRLAQATGGLYFHDNNDLNLGFRRLGLEPPVTYELAFTPASMPRDGKFHRLKVELVPPIKGAVIQAREGYYDPEPLTPAEQLGPALEKAMTGKAETDDVPVKIAVSTGPNGVGVDAHFDIGKLAFVSAHGRKQQLLLVIAALYDKQGQFVAGQRGTMNLALDGSHYKHFEKNGLGATLRVAAPPDRYRLRVAVGEASDGKLSTFTRTITVH